MLIPQSHWHVPEETQEIAGAAFPKGNPYMKMRDELGIFYEDKRFGDLFSHTGQPALAPWRLVLVGKVYWSLAQYCLRRSLVSYDYAIC